MKIDTLQVKAIANLARIHIDEEDVKQYAADMERTLSLFDELEKTDMKNIEPMAHPLSEANAHCRDDIVSIDMLENDRMHRTQAVAPMTENNLYLVPVVIDEE